MKYAKLILAVLVIVMTTVHSNAQSSSMSESRRSLATVIFAGLGGAVLGLSTLSFYGQPEEHIGNIWTGLALGVVAGGGYVIYQNSYQGQEAGLESQKNWSRGQKASTPLFVYSFEF